MLAIIRSSLATLYDLLAYASGALVKCRKVGVLQTGVTRPRKKSSLTGEQSTNQQSMSLLIS